MQNGTSISNGNSVNGHDPRHQPLLNEADAVGKHFASYRAKTGRSEIYLCASSLPDGTFRLNNVNDNADTIFCTFNQMRTVLLAVDERPQHWWVWRWHCIIPKDSLQPKATGL